MGSDTIFHGSWLSAYEHLVPEKFWTNEQNPGEGVSAVKALAKAAAAGQKIYTLTAQNAAMVYRLQVDDAIRMEIQNALNAGRTVTVHEAPLTVSGWTGTGYIIDDPATGAGAYKISGGANGGWYNFIVGSGYGALAFLALFLGKASLLAGMVGALSATLAIVGILVAIFALAIAIDALMISYSSDDTSYGCFLGGFFAPFALVSSRFLEAIQRYIGLIGIIYSGTGILQCLGVR
jgi:hypothetical protein